MQAERCLRKMRKKLNILGGQTASAERGLSSGIDEASALKKLAAMCAKGEHCTGEADQKMRGWGVDANARSRVIGKLVAAKFIDDGRYTRYFVSDKIKLNHWGRMKIAMALRQKHVDEDIINNTLDAVSDEDYLAVLRPMIRDKMKTVSAHTDYERAMKTIKWAMGRGFGIELIRKCIDIETNSYESAED